MRQTAAEARRLLIEMGGKALGVPPADLTVTDGVVHSVADPSKRISYAELIGGRHLDAPVEWKGEAQQLTVKVRAPLKKPAEFKVIGKSYPRRDMPGKVFGTLKQVTDVRLPNMLHARMIRPPVAGAVPVTVDEASIKDIPGAKVVWIKDFLAVVAEKEWNAVRAAKALKVTWSHSKPNFPGHDKLFDHIRNAPWSRVPPTATTGPSGHPANAPMGHRWRTAFKQAVRVLEGEYEYPTPMPAWAPPARLPMCATDNATVWTSTQKPFDCAMGIAELAGAAARESAGDLDVRHGRLCPRRSGRRDGRRRGAVQASEAPGARAIYASRSRWPGTRRAPRPSTGIAPGSMRPAI